MAGKKGKSGKNPNSIKNLEKRKPFGTPGGDKPMNGDHGYPYERWSLRMTQRHLAAQEIDPFDKDAIQKLIGKRKLTIAETMAIRQIQRGMVNESACVNVTNNIEGELDKNFVVKSPPKETP